MNRIAKHFLFFFLASASLFGQVEYEVNPPEYIKSIIFRGPNEGDQFPIIKLGESITLLFDDIRAREADYYYTIQHCNFDWTPSTNLSKFEYLRGFDNERIIDYSNSFGTLQSYSTYRLRLPNQETGFKLSGNYIMKIYDDDDELMFTRRFVIYQDAAAVGVSTFRSRDMSIIDQAQAVRFTINLTGVRVQNPMQEVKVALLQNYDWNTAITNLKPQFVLGNELSYRYDKEASFWGGNEYFNFDNKDILGANASISHTERTDLHHNYLYTNITRENRPYTYNPDINGDFVIRTLQGRNNRTEAEYAYVHFSLENYRKIGFGSIHVYGKFNNYAIDDSTKMTYNENTGLYQCTLLLKQGFYNYKYILVDENGNIDDTAISGSFSQTENTYTVLVYFRRFGDRHDSVIGVGSGTSVNINN